MRKTLFFAIGLVSMTAYAQTGNVGVNTDKPEATLHLKVASMNANGNDDDYNKTNQGIIIPKMSKSRVAMISTENLVEGTIIYVVDENSIEFPNSQIYAYTGNNNAVKNINSKGFYHFINGFWEKGLATDIPLNGDVIGNTNTNTVTKIQGNPITQNTPNEYDILRWDGEKWINRELFTSKSEYVQDHIIAEYFYHYAPTSTWKLPNGILTVIDINSNDGKMLYSGEANIVYGNESEDIGEKVYLRDFDFSICWGYPGSGGLFDISQTGGVRCYNFNEDSSESKSYVINFSYLERIK